MRYAILFTITILGLTLSCKKEGVNKKTYVYYSLNGASCNGEFKIEDDNDPETLVGVSLIAPETADNPAVVFITISDPINSRQVAFQLPAKKGGPFVMLADSEHFGMGIIDPVNEWILTSGVENTVSGVSVDITRYEEETGLFGFGALKYMEGNFEGIMTYKNEMNEIEQHTVKGDFFFNGTF